MGLKPIAIITILAQGNGVFLLKTAFADGAYKLTTTVAWYNLFAGEKLNRHNKNSIQF